VEAAFVTGLLHDVGLQLMITLHETQTNALLDARGCLDGGDLEDERAHFGTDHPELGAAALRRWSLPDGVSDAVAAHHRPIGRHGVARPRDVALLHVADALACAVPASSTPEEAAAVAMRHPSAQVLRAVRGAYVATAEQLFHHWDGLAEF
jgi:HD-like signal output (HDOD) protein